VTSFTQPQCTLAKPHSYRVDRLSTTHLFELKTGVVWIRAPEGIGPICLLLNFSWERIKLLAEFFGDAGVHSYEVLDGKTSSSGIGSSAAIS
jgi:hypothetical protein